MRHLTLITSLAAGTLAFAFVLASVGLSKVIELFGNLSASYLMLFLAATSLFYFFYFLRWSAVLEYMGVRAPLAILARYKLIGFSISYITPVSRLGGEPLKVFLFKNRMKLPGTVAVSSMLLENSIGMSIDVFLMAVLMLVMLVFFALPQEFSSIASLVLPAVLVLLAFYFYVLIKQKGPFSSLFVLFNLLVKKPFLMKLIMQTRKVEELMLTFIKSKKSGVLKTIAISSVSWPLTFLQYKFALLSLGYDASLQIILLSVLATNIAASIPIPGAFGAQEAGHSFVFSLVGVAHVGIALAFLLRFKDLVVTAIGLFLLSHEGISLVDVLRKGRYRKLR